MSFKNVYFILVRPQLGENIGSVARALKNFNFSKLRIVNPKSGWPNQKAIVTSVGAKNVLQSSRVYNSLDKSVGDLEIAINLAIKSKEKTLLIVIYNNQNQRRYIGVKLD